jgi:hypothetical protein
MSSALLGTLPPTVPAGVDWEIKAQRARIPGYTSCDAGTVKVVECSTMTTFWQAAPDALALAIRCAEAHVVVGYSMHVVGDHGLYAAKDFAAGEVLFVAHSNAGVWVCDDARAVSANKPIIEINVAQPFRKPHTMILAGDTARHPWACLNSAFNTGKPANVTLDFIGGDMTDNALVFKAAVDINAFGTELLWDYPVSSKVSLQAKPGPPAKLGTSLAASADDESLATPANTVTTAPVATSVGTASDEAASSNTQAAANEDDSSSSNSSDDSSEEAAPTAAAQTTAMTPTRLKAEGTCVCTLDAKTNCTVYSLPDSLYALFGKASKKISSQTLLSVKAGSVLKDQSWKHIPYNITEKSLVSVEGKLIKLGDTLSEMEVQHVWGKSIQLKKGKSHVADVVADGAPIELWWQPAQDTSSLGVDALAILEKLLSIPNVKVVFVMEEHILDEKKSLVPSGILLHLAKTYSFPEKGVLCKF